MEQCASESELDHPPSRSPAVPRIPQDARLQALQQARMRQRQVFFASKPTMPTPLKPGTIDTWVMKPQQDEMGMGDHAYKCI